jgi:large subunit ribosomal protein L3
MKFILAEKKEMTQKFAPDGTVLPVTRVLAGPCVVTQVKKAEGDGYSAVQLGFGQKRKISQSLKGHLKNLGNLRYLKEFRVDAAAAEKLKVGNKLLANVFTPGDIVRVTGISKGKGFQGVVKRHGFHGSPASHGHKDQLRMPGSIGAGGVQHVFKGTRMGGHMGDEQVTVTNLEIIEVNPEKNEIYIKGAIPGARGNLVWLTGEGEVVIESEAPAPVAAAAEEKTEVTAEPAAEAPVADVPATEAKA